MRTIVLAFFISLILTSGYSASDSPDQEISKTQEIREGMEVATFAGGCYWCMEASFEKLAGLEDVISGYAVGKRDNSKETVPVEAIQVIFDPAGISYSDLLDYYWRQFDPTDAGGSFHDRGPEYESYIFYHNDSQKSLAWTTKKRLEKSGIFEKPVVTKIVRFVSFKPVEESEQDFYKKNPERYHSYRKASGRDEFIQSVWGDSGKID